MVADLHIHSFFLRAYPNMYSLYLKVRNNSSFIIKLANRYTGGQNKLRKTVTTREDVIRD